MRRSPFRFGGWIPAILSLFSLKGCKPASPPTVVTPGVSIEMAYPVVLIGQGSLDVKDSVDDVIGIHGYSGINLIERVILDSDGRIFEIVESFQEPGRKPWFLDMGTSVRSYEVIVREKKKPEMTKIRELFLEQVNSPRSYWSGDPNAIARVESLGSVTEAIEACRTPWEWMQ